MFSIDSIGLSDRSGSAVGVKPGRSLCRLTPCTTSIDCQRVPVTPTRSIDLLGSQDRTVGTVRSKRSFLPQVSIVFSMSIKRHKKSIDCCPNSINPLINPNFNRHPDRHGGRFSDKRTRFVLGGGHHALDQDVNPRRSSDERGRWRDRNDRLGGRLGDDWGLGHRSVLRSRV
jgi:hypothetical protein